MIVNKQARELKVSMLITKTFALGDNSIHKQNDRICDSAYRAMGLKETPRAVIPRESIVKPADDTE